MKKKKILVIDDDQNFTSLVKMNLEDTGDYEVRTENRGTFGMADIVSFNPDLILLDVVMSDITGFDFASYAFEHGLRRDIPIIYVTGLLHVEEGKPQDHYEGCRIMQKPVSTKDLLTAIESALA